jgi:hypothetical protein
MLEVDAHLAHIKNLKASRLRQSMREVFASKCLVGETVGSIFVIGDRDESTNQFEQMPFVVFEIAAGVLLGHLAVLISYSLPDILNRALGLK